MSKFDMIRFLVLMPGSDTGFCVAFRSRSGSSSASLPVLRPFAPAHLRSLGASSPRAA